MAYSSIYSNFPSRNITLHNFKNVDKSSVSYTLDGTTVNTTIYDLVTEIASLQASVLNADKIKAANLINANATILAQYYVDATTYNTWEEEIWNTQNYAKSVLQSTHFGTEEPDCSVEDVWIGGEGATDYD